MFDQAPIVKLFVVLFQASPRNPLAKDYVLFVFVVFFDQVS